MNERLRLPSEVIASRLFGEGYRVSNYANYVARDDDPMLVTIPGRGELPFCSGSTTFAQILDSLEVDCEDGHAGEILRLLCVFTNQQNGS